MKLELSTDHAADLLRRDEYASWSYAGARAIVEYLEQIEDETGQDIAFDAVAIRCDYSEWDSLTVWADAYFGSDSDWLEEVGADTETAPDDLDDLVRDYIRDRGDLIEFNGGVIVSSF